MDSKKIGVFISELRKELGLTQIALADMLNVSNRAVSKWENGDGYPDVTILPTLAEALGVTVDELLAGEKKDSNKPAILFRNSYFYDEKSVVAVVKKFLRDRMPAYYIVSIILFFTMLMISFVNFSSENIKFMLPVCVGAIVLLLIIMFIIPKITGKIEYNDVKKIIGDEDEMTTYEISDKIYAYRGNSKSEFNFSSVTKLDENDELFMLFLGKGHYLYLRKDSFTIGDADSFREFIIGKIKPSKTLKRRKRIAVLGTVLMISLSVFLAPLNIIYSLMKSDEYEYARIEVQQEYFDTNRTEFDRAVERIKNDEIIQNDVLKDGVKYVESNDYTALTDLIGYLDIGKDFIDFELDYVDGYDSGFLYYEGGSLPFPYQVGFEHSNLDNKSYNYVSEDDVYLLGKTENNTVPADDGWFLLKTLDNNWYYYEYY